MKNADINFEKLLNVAKNNRPVLTHSDTLTNSIMLEISNSGVRTKFVFLHWFRAVSAAAVFFLLVLFVYQQYEHNTDQLLANQSAFLTYPVSLHTDCIPDSVRSKQDLLKVYYCHMQRNSEKNKLNQLIYKQLNNDDYENRD